MQGYAGRTGVFEVMVMTRGLRQMILNKQPTEVLRQKAVDEGMVEFREAALLKVAPAKPASKKSSARCRRN